MSSPPADFFHDAYDRTEIAYGMEPSPELAAYLKQVCVQDGRALDLGAGAGRDTLAMASSGYHVTSVDMSPRGVQRIQERAAEFGLGDRIDARVGDVRDLELPADHYDAVIATTVLDHIPSQDAEALWKKIIGSLTDVGVIYVQVHTTEDPGSGQYPGNLSDAPISETADAVINYFRPNQLVSWACHPDANLRVLRYEERIEWDCTHGPPHQHGKAVLLAVRAGYFPSWYGQPPAFPPSKE
ncbi:MAG: class I SAM-dependent methyltransferase [Planctomycetota bacterium]